jgi:hypothetical protein
MRLGRRWCYRRTRGRRGREMSHRWPAAPAANGAWRLAQDSGAGVARGSGERPLGIDGVLPQAIRGHPASTRSEPADGGRSRRQRRRVGVVVPHVPPLCRGR